MKLKENMELSMILGQDNAKELIKTVLVAQRNILLIGPPGTGKTTMAKNIANLIPETEVMDCQFNCNPENPSCPECREGKTSGKKTIRQNFVRIQGSPDLVVEDMIGDIDPEVAMKFGPSSIKAFSPGKIFKANNGVLFFDELNRCPEKLQNALLQVLEEKIVTLGSFTIDVPVDFVFIATMNPEDSSTEKLSEVLLDRFDVIYMGYPESEEIEKQILSEKAKTIVRVPHFVVDFIVGYIRTLRQNPDLEKKPSVRASIGLYESASAHAKVMSKDAADFDDVEAVMKSVLEHRIKLKPSLKYVQKEKDLLEQEYGKFKDSFKQIGDGP